MKGSLPYLQILMKFKPKIRKVILEHEPNDLLLSICESCYNVLKGTIPLSKRQKQQHTQMSELLYRKDLSDDEKKAMYDANLERYLDLKQKKDDAVPTVRLATSNNELGNRELITPPRERQAL